MTDVRHAPIEGAKQRLLVDHWSGDQFVLVVRIDVPSQPTEAAQAAAAARLAAWDAATPELHVRTARRATSVLATAGVTSEVTETRGVWTFTIDATDDTDGWTPGSRLYFDIQVGGQTYFGGSSITVCDDVTRDEDESS